MKGLWVVCYLHFLCSVGSFSCAFTDSCVSLCWWLVGFVGVLVFVVFGFGLVSLFACLVECVWLVDLLWFIVLVWYVC